MDAPKHICLITPGHVASCPRIVKEADALAVAGYNVTVVAGRNFGPADDLDSSIVASARWKLDKVETGRGFRIQLRRRAGSLLRFVLGGQRCPGTGVAQLALCASLPALTKAAVATDADFYHGHCLGGLAAAALAAKVSGRRYGFDAEDFHERETTEVEEGIFENSAVVLLLRAFLGGAAIRTAASPLIAEAYEQAYGTRMATIFNSFGALPEGKSSDAARDFRRDDPAKLYWFSQTIGPGRGLEQMIDALARAKTPARLQLRGFAGAAYRADLERTAGQAGVDLELLPPANPGDMVALAAQADVGLSLEQRTPGNRDLCLTNKVFAYLAAGVPQLMSRTSAQESFAMEVGDAALIVDLNDAAATSHSLDAFLSSKDRLMAARRAAASAQKRFGWPVEKEKLLQLFNKAV